LLPQSNDDGKLLENTVFLNLRRKCKPTDKIFYYQGNKECDFVIQRNETIGELIQACWDLSDENTGQRKIEGLLEACHVTNCTRMTIITNDEEDGFMEEEMTIRVIPVWKWLLL